MSDMIISLGYRKNGFDAYGGTILRKEDMTYWTNREERTDPEGVALGLDEKIREVEEGFFELLPTISEIWIQGSKCNLHLEDKTVKLFQDNNVILRGRYNTDAEKLARQYNLRFLHLDVELGRWGDYFDRGADQITLRFRSSGTAYIHQDSMCQGSAPGWTGGGEVSFDLPNDFYLKMSAEEIAEKCWHSNGILENGILASFLDKAIKKGGYMLDFRNLPPKKTKKNKK